MEVVVVVKSHVHKKFKFMNYIEFVDFNFFPSVKKFCHPHSIHVSSRYGQRSVSSNQNSLSRNFEATTSPSGHQLSSALIFIAPIVLLQNISRISMIGRLQSGQNPRFNHSSLEHTLQNVCPHGINAAPFFLPMHTQHIESFPASSLFFSATPKLPRPPSLPSVSFSSRISDTFNGVSVTIIPPSESKSLLLDSTNPTSAPRGDALKRRSAARAVAKFIVAGDGTDNGLIKLRSNCLSS